MTNKEIQDRLKAFPNDTEVRFSRSEHKMTNKQFQELLEGFADDLEMRFACESFEIVKDGTSKVSVAGYNASDSEKYLYISLKEDK